MPNEHAESAEFLDLILRCLPAFVVAADTELRFTAIRGTVLEQLGLNEEAIRKLIHTPIDAYFTGEAGRDVLQRARDALEGSSSSFETEWLGHWFTAHVAPLKNAFGKIVGVVAVGMDISRRHQLLGELEAERQMLKHAQELAEVGSWVIDVAAGTVHVSDELAHLLGIAPVPTTISEHQIRDYFRDEDYSLLLEERDRAMRSCGSYDFDHDIVRADGTIRHVRSRGHVECDASGKPVRCLGTMLDVTERVEAQRTAELLAYHDPLTGLPNRWLLRDRLRHAIAEARREDAKVFVVFLDLDDFKRINDSLGHAEGDVLLAEVGQRLHAATRETDTVARTGGDEFVVVVTKVPGEGGFEMAMRKIRNVFQMPFRLRGGEYRITASIGVAVYPNDAMTDDDLLKDADSAMYDAKKAGRNEIRRYRGTSLASTIRRVQLEVDLPRAFSQSEFAVYYQPVVRSSDLQIVGVEALLRWNHPVRGVLLPAAFLDAMEESDYIKIVGEWILHEAASQVSSWRKRFSIPLRLAVNVSARQLVHNGFPAMLQRALEQARIEPSAVDIELTETTLVRDLEWASSLLGDIRKLGIGIAIDDFGTGYNSLSYLKHFPVSALKIDRSFVREIGIDAFDEAISFAVAALGKALRIRVVAEGVETREQLDSLRALGCDEVQGFYFAPPLRASQLTSTLLAGAAGQA